MGWSYRIVARGLAPAVTSNRGSAYNSAISLSVSAGIDCVLLATPTGFEVFREGRGTPVPVSHDDYVHTLDVLAAVQQMKPVTNKPKNS